MKVKCADVVVKDRFRKDLGELDGLMESIRLIGLLQAIGITKDNVLVFGQIRLLACQMLGYEDIEARLIDLPSIIQGEYAENEFRKDFTVSERVAIGKAIEQGIGERRGGNHEIKCSGVNPQIFADCNDDLSGKETREIASGIAAFGNRETYRQAKVVVEKGTPDLVAKVDSKKITINAAYKEIQNMEKKIERDKRMKEAADKYQEDESLTIVCSDFYPWCAEHLADESVDFILTDPPYEKESLHVWGQLGEVATRVLKPGGYLATYSGQLYLNYVMRMLDEHLSYCWMMSLYHTGPTQLVHPRNAVCTWKPILVYRKGEPGKFESALVDSITNDYRDKEFHNWGQGESAVSYLMRIFSSPNDLVLDPFAGGGTTIAVAKALKRKCIGIEIDAQYLDAIKSRCV